MFVVVFLIDPKKHIIVPEEFVCELNEESLKNNGRNSNFAYKIFWSNNALNVENVPSADYQPNFDLPRSTVYPPEAEACYIGRLIKFFKSFERAKEYCKKRRPFDTAVYNEARLREVPIPACSFAAENANQPENNPGENSNHEERECEEWSDILSLSEIEAHDNENTNDDLGLIDEQPIQSTEQYVDVKDPLGNVEMNVAEIAAFSTIFERRNTTENNNDLNIEQTGCSGNDTSNKQVEADNQNVENANEIERNVEQTTNGHASLSTYNPGENETIKITSDGRKWVTKSFCNDCDDSDDLQMTYELGISFKPMDAGYQVKLNDLLSGDIPFRENYNKDRAYLVGKTEIKLPVRVVDGLLKFNAPDSRLDMNIDRLFLKALLLGTCSLKNIEVNQKIEKDAFAFIKDIFLHRIKDSSDETTRYLVFNSLLEQAREEIRQKNYR